MIWLAVAAIGIFVLALRWRVASSRASLPCPSWLSWMVELDNPVFRNNRSSAMIKGLELQTDISVVDVGCGPGRLTLPMAIVVGPIGNVVAFDLQREMLAKVEATARLAGLSNIAFQQGAIGSGTFVGGPFDRATLATVLGEIPNQRAALGEIFSALRPGGLLAVTELIADPHFQSRSHVLRLAEAAGFREKSRTGNALAYTLYLEKPTTASP